MGMVVVKVMLELAEVWEVVVEMMVVEVVAEVMGG